MITQLFMLAADSPVPHAVDHDFMGYWSAHVGNLVIVGALMIALFLWAAKQIGTGPESQGNERYITTNPFAHMIEVICVYLRENTVRPILHERTDKYMPYLWTLFFFILLNNLFGLVPFLDLLHLLPFGLKEAHAAPFGGTATQNIFVTGALALIAFFVINISGIQQLGIGGYCKHLTADTPPLLWPLIVPIEIAGTFIKPIALAIRLFANMTAGHILVATLFMFIGMVFAPDTRSILLTPSVTLVSSVAAILIYFLELFVAFLQAFVFMFLTTVFIGMLSHHHDDEHAHGDVAHA